ncbi:MAG: hypothetical protein IIZ45_04115 [Firmicutes bacterium]|nr:hypothetical protein [Bacillota bacterium]
MVQAVMVIACLIVAGSLFCIIRGLARLYRSGETRRAAAATVFFVAVPLLVWGAVSLTDAASKLVWVYLPVVFLSLLWIAAGYGLAVVMRKNLRERLEAMVKEDPTPPKYWLLKTVLCFGGAVAVWAFGTFVGFGRFAILEVAAVCAMIFLFSAAIYILWQCRDIF